LAALTGVNAVTGQQKQHRRRPEERQPLWPLFILGHSPHSVIIRRGQVGLDWYIASLVYWCPGWSIGAPAALALLWSLLCQKAANFPVVP